MIIRIKSAQIVMIGMDSEHTMPAVGASAVFARTWHAAADIGVQWEWKNRAHQVDKAHCFGFRHLSAKNVGHDEGSVLVELP